MRVLLVGGGGREHALAWKLAQSPSVEKLIAAPGNAGISAVAESRPVEATDVPGLVELAKKDSVDLVVVGPEAPLVEGLVDRLQENGVVAFGPRAEGALIEGSKVWAKELCISLGIPTARSETFDDAAAADRYLETLSPPYVVKAEGLAAGKGVTVATSRDEAVAAVNAALVDRAFGDAGDRVLIEEFLDGREVSALALTDGETVVPLAPAQDFKRAGDGDTGPNTGGMGAYSPVPFVDEPIWQRISAEILEPVVAGLRDRGIRYRGVLYAGLMLTSEGPKVLEFNCRFGDPETQAIIPRLDSDLAELLLSTAEGRLEEAKVSWRPEACVTVVLASGGYPGSYETGVSIDGLEEAAAVGGVTMFHAGTTLRDGRVVTAGGRVLAVSALGKGLAEARDRAYRAASLISFEGMHHRMDIAK
ncbi:MAG: phosphoribosylamine--glycine ligase, partial [Actinomycetota bacterium]